MTQVRLDKVDFSTLHEAPKNYDTISKDVVISGSVASGAFANFSATIPYTRSGTRADVYLDGNSRRVSASSGSRAADAVYSYKSTETFSVLVSYSTTDITVTLSIFNGDAVSLTLNTQTITTIAVLLDAPIGSL